MHLLLTSVPLPSSPGSSLAIKSQDEQSEATGLAGHQGFTIVKNFILQLIF